MQLNYYFFAMVSLAITTIAQTPTSTDSQLLTIGFPTETPAAANIPSCVLQCLTQAAQAVGCATTDKTCACTNPSFQQSSQLCLQSTCSPLDQATATLLQENQCNTAKVSSMTHPSTTARVAPASTTTTLLSDALTPGYGVGNMGWVAVAGALGIIVAL